MKIIAINTLFNNSISFAYKLLLLLPNSITHETHENTRKILLHSQRGLWEQEETVESVELVKLGIFEFIFC